ncbi:MAG: pyruvate kinase [Planctomycetes bacterium]|nr:pyruvate kinase [Planctomycetota bacterium]
MPVSPTQVQEIESPAAVARLAQPRRAARAAPADTSLLDIVTSLRSLGEEMRDYARLNDGVLDAIAEPYQRSAVNLLQYLALRRHDLRDLQQRLSGLGLSSLGRSESHALATVEAVLRALHALARLPEFKPDKQTLGFEQGDQLLRGHTSSLLGHAPKGRESRIMVTMPSEAAKDYALVRDLVQNGMNVMRINCAHDSQPQWLAMVKNLRKACRSLRRRCLVLMDLPGPKLRTGPMQPGSTAFKLSPERNARGRLLSPAKLLLVSERPSGPLPACDAMVRVPQALLRSLTTGLRLRLTDTRKRPRSLTCALGGRGWRLLEARKSCILDNGTKLRAPDGRKHKIAGLVPEPGELVINVGDFVALTPEGRPGRMTTRQVAGLPRRVAVVPCTLPEVIAQVKVGEPVWFDDGKIGGLVAAASADELLIEVVHARENGGKLAADKGINLPHSDLHLDALTKKDREDLPFAVEHADLVGLSFVNCADDVTSLHQALGTLTDAKPGIILKIETQRGFANLASIILAAMRTYPVGVMIARGDLAVECGFERLAEVQEEILWICEAAHVPVVWATQVLETLAKKGAPTRAEITDAAMAERAECVMLNKGPHIRKALHTLDNILRRMQGHQSKKRAMLRQLNVANNMWPAAPEKTAQHA